MWSMLFPGRHLIPLNKPHIFFLCSSSSSNDTLFCPYSPVLKKLHPSFQMWPHRISIENAWLREKNIYQWKPFICFPESWTVCVCGCGSLCTLWSSQYVQLSPLLHTSWCGFAHRITNYSLHSNSLLRAHNLHKRKTSQCHTPALIEADTLTPLCWLKDCALKGHFSFVRCWQDAVFYFSFFHTTHQRSVLYRAYQRYIRTMSYREVCIVIFLCLLRLIILHNS